MVKATMNVSDEMQAALELEKKRLKYRTHYDRHREKILARKKAQNEAKRQERLLRGEVVRQGPKPKARELNVKLDHKGNVVAVG